jgi:hypothetical protein
MWFLWLLLVGDFAASGLHPANVLEMHGGSQNRSTDYYSGPGYFSEIPSRRRNWEAKLFGEHRLAEV